MSLEEFLEEWNNDSPYVEVKTSGSTGEPKRMLVEKQRMRASARITCDFLGLKAGDTALLCMSLDYIAGKMMVVRAIERNLRLIVVEPSGHPLAEQICREWDLRSFRPLLASPNIGEELAAMVPMQVYNSLQVPEERERLKQIKHLIIGGGAIDEAMAEELKTFPNHVWSTYGMTETLSHIALRRLSGPEASEWYTPFPSVSVSLNGEGCLVIDAPEVCKERLVTNDIAELATQRGQSLMCSVNSAHEGQSPCVANVPFKILGRRDNVICSGGIKIQAEEVERILKAHLRVPYLISKRPDKKFGEVVVLLTEGDVEESKTVCEAVLPKFQRPKAYIHVSEIPLTETKKPARRQAEVLARG
ncbi:MAG: AMP-binding protein [Prevotella sp.]|nr:AMP-binding protein [Prevotella sp.]